VLAGYGAKSAQISHLARSLNLGLESFVFVDDNPVELAEVATALPQVTIRTFPDRDEGIPALFQELAADFRRDVITAEDRNRTEMYRRRFESIAPIELAGADLTAFLRELSMTLTIHDRSSGDRTRAVQLINKTNQFNLNGRRVEDADIASILAGGGRLYGASLADRTGSHGEILSCLVDSRGVMRAFVMSCRVFQRRVEHAFLAWLCAQAGAPTLLDYAETPRNEPFRIFLRDAAFTVSGDAVKLDPDAFRTGHGESLGLFALRPPEVRA
jgi:FkbH-like protein